MLFSCLAKSFDRYNLTVYFRVAEGASSCKGKTCKGNANDSDLVFSCQYHLKQIIFSNLFSFLECGSDFLAIMSHINMINAYNVCFVQFGYSVVSYIMRNFQLGTSLMENTVISTVGFV